MSGELRADHGVLDGIASTLRNSASDLEGLGGSAPSAPDAGEAGPPMAEMISFLLSNAAQYAAAVSGVGDSVAQGSTDFMNTEEGARESLNATGGE